jgi:hypothetical protein
MFKIERSIAVPYFSREQLLSLVGGAIDELMQAWEIERPSIFYGGKDKYSISMISDLFEGSIYIQEGLLSINGSFDRFSWTKEDEFKRNLDNWVHDLFNVSEDL